MHYARARDLKNQRQHSKPFEQLRLNLSGGFQGSLSLTGMGA
jgi:hypothetical protein